MAAKFRGVLIGCGFFARNHMNAWAGLKNAEIIGVCDIDQAKADAYSKDFGAASFTDAKAMLEQLKPDFVDIATTVGSHRALVELAAKHAKLVICQKPFAETYIDGKAMVEACDTSGATLLVHENFRWQLPYRALKTTLERGDIGQPKFLRLSFRHAFNIYTNQPYLAEVIDLALTDVGLHLFDLARFLLGDVTRVSCETQKRNPSIKGQDEFLAQMRHTSGAISSIDCSFFSDQSPDPFPETLAWIEGETGTLELRQGYVLRLHQNGKVTETNVEPGVPHWGARPWHAAQDSVIALEAHALDILAGRSQPQPSGAHNLETLLLTLAAIQSSRSGQTIDLSTFRVREGG